MKRTESKAPVCPTTAEIAGEVLLNMSWVSLFILSAAFLMENAWK